MKIYKLSQDLNDGYDAYDSFIVIAKNEDEARLIHPSQSVTHITIIDGKPQFMGTYGDGSGHYIARDMGWVEFDEVDQIKVEYIGTAKPGSKPGIVVSSFNAG